MWLFDWRGHRVFASAEKLPQAFANLQLWKHNSSGAAAYQEAEVLNFWMKPFATTHLHFSKLQTLLLYDLPEIKHKDQVCEDLKAALPECDVQFPYAQASELVKEQEEKKNI